MNCPVCGQAGLPDYNMQTVVCAQCNSNLAPLKVLYSLSQVQKKRNLVLLIGYLVTFFVVLILITIKNKKEIKEYQKESQNYKSIVGELTDSIHKLKRPDKLKSSEDTGLKRNVFSYVVKSGDYTWKIAEMFYGDGKYYKSIEQENELRQPYILRKGQILKIKNLN